MEDRPDLDAETGPGSRASAKAAATHAIDRVDALVGQAGAVSAIPNVR